MLLSGLIVLSLAGLMNFYFSIQILRRVSAADIKISFFEIRWQVHKQLKNYCALTRQDSDRIGTAFFGYWLTLLLMVVAGVVLLVELTG